MTGELHEEPAGEEQTKLNEKLRLKYSLAFPLLFTLVAWMIKLSEIALNSDFSILGIYPRTLWGLIGIILAPLIHANIHHLLSNTIPLLTLSVAIFYFYRGIAMKIFLTTYILSGLGVWIIGRPAYHIGASGLVYGFASFLFFSGIIRNDIKLLSISLLVIFMYGSLVWGIFPFVYNISWESHLMGGIIGFALAIIYRHHGPKAQPPSWEDEPDSDDDFAFSDEEDKVDKEKEQTILKIGIINADCSKLKIDVNLYNG